MKYSRPIIRRFLLPILFAVLLFAGVLLILASANPANDDIAEDILRFDLLSDEKNLAQICAWSENGTDFFLFLPSFASPDNAVFAPLHGKSITIDGAPYRKGDRLLSVLPDQCYSLTVSGNPENRLTLTVMQSSSSVPALFVGTSSHAMEKVHNDKNHKEKASLILYTENGNVEYEGTGLDEIKGRGNSSWNLDKKPYHLNLSAAVSLLGMNRSRHWILLSNGWDPTNLRNKLVYDFARKTALPWTPECRYVDLFLNGMYNGLYLLSEQAEFDAERISPVDFENSFLAEITQLRKIGENDRYFRTQGRRYFKIVEPDQYRTKRFSSIYQTIQKTEDAILSLTEDSAWPEFLDLDSFVRRYLVDEIFLNLDSDSSSSYYYWDAAAQKMYACPVWDYDLSCGNPSHDLTDRTMFPNQLYAKNMPYYRKMYANRVFFARMTELYRTEFLPLLTSLPGNELPDLESFIARSGSMNAVRWSGMYRVMRDGQQSDAEKRAELRRFLIERDVFLRSAWIDMKNYVSVRIRGNDGSVVSVFTAEAGASVKDVPSPASFGMSGSDRWYPSGTDTPIAPETLLTDDLNLFPLPHSARAEMTEQPENEPEGWNKASGPMDYLIRLVRHDGAIVIPLFSLLLLLAVMLVYALLNGRKTGGRKK